MALGAAVVVILGLTFALGLLVGRQWARHPVAAGPGGEGVTKASARRGGLAADVLVDRPPDGADKLTFYQTLIEPLHGQGSAPRTEAKPVSVKLPPVPPAPAPVVASAAAPAPTTPKPAPSLPPATGKSGAGSSAGPAAAPATPAVAPPTAAAPPWTIQVGAFKNRKQADDMRQHLAASGLDAYVASVAVKEGQAPFRVRIGTYRTRDEAAAAAERLRGQRSLTTFVTLK